MVESLGRLGGREEGWEEEAERCSSCSETGVDAMLPKWMAVGR